MISPFFVLANNGNVAPFSYAETESNAELQDIFLGVNGR